MKRILLALVFMAMVAGTYANAQLASALKVTACAGQSLALGGAAPLTMDLTGDLCTNATNGSGITISGPVGG